MELASGKRYAQSYTLPGRRLSNVWLSQQGLCAGCDPHGSSQPLRLARISVIYGIENEFDSRRDSQLLENTEEILLDRVFTQIEFNRDLTVA